MEEDAVEVELTVLKNETEVPGGKLWAQTRAAEKVETKEAVAVDAGVEEEVKVEVAATQLIKKGKSGHMSERRANRHTAKRKRNEDSKRRVAISATNPSSQQQCPPPCFPSVTFFFRKRHTEPKNTYISIRGSKKSAWVLPDVAILAYRECGGACI